MEYSNKIYPPIIDSELPSIKKNKNSYLFELPISYNRFNTPLQVTGCTIRIISAVTGKQICEVKTADFNNNSLKNIAYFELPTVFYKLAEEYDPLETYYSNQTSTSFYEVNLPLGQDSFIPNHFFIIDKEKSVNWIVGNYYKIQAAFNFLDGSPPQEYVSSFSTFGTTKLIDISDFQVSIAGLNNVFYKLAANYDPIETYYNYSSSTDSYEQISVNENSFEPNTFFIKETVENIAKGYYTGEFQIKDRSEQVKEYCFRIYTVNQNNIIFGQPQQELFYDTGPLIHDNSTNYIDDNGILHGQDFFESYLILNDLEDYFIEYEITTINNCTITSDRYIVANYFALPPDIQCNIYAKQNYITNGIEVFMRGIKNEQNIEDSVSGNFLLLRTELNSSNQSWSAPVEVLKINLNNTTPSEQEIVDTNIIFKDRLLWQDYTVGQGIKYKYYLQQYWSGNIHTNNKYYSEYIPSNEIIPDFEDASLFDGEKQLIIKYNPKITNFKTTKIDSKQDTIGGKFPYIFRGANTNYKEFTISGLISYTADELGSFDKKYAVNEDIDRDQTPTIQTNFNIRSYDLTSENFARERQFKLEVLDWLNDGKTKLFRSPSEGNYLVRLMNVNLTPNESLGRLLHTFSCTAYEVADCNFMTLIDQKVIQQNDITFQEYQIIEDVFVEQSELNTTEEKIYRYPEEGNKTFSGLVRIPVNENDIIEFYQADDTLNLQLDSNRKYSFQFAAGPNLYCYEIPMAATTGYFLLKMNNSVVRTPKIFYDYVSNPTQSYPSNSSYYKDEFTLERSYVMCSQILENHNSTNTRFLKGKAGPIRESELQANLNNIFNTFKFYTIRFETNYLDEPPNEAWTDKDYMVIINGEETNVQQEIDMRHSKWYEIHNLTNVTQLYVGAAVTVTWSGRQWRYTQS